MPKDLPTTLEHLVWLSRAKELAYLYADLPFKERLQQALAVATEEPRQPDELTLKLATWSLRPYDKLR